GIEDVVPAGDSQMKAADLVLAVSDREVAREVSAGYVGSHHVGLSGRAIGNGSSPDQGRDALELGGGPTNRPRPGKRHFIDELDERGPDLIQRWIVVEMLAVDIRDDCHDRRKL